MKPVIQLMFRLTVPVLMGTAFTYYSQIWVGGGVRHDVHIALGVRPDISGVIPE